MAAPEGGRIFVVPRSAPLNIVDSDGQTESASAAESAGAASLRDTTPATPPSTGVTLNAQHSEEFDEVTAYAPTALVRWGILVISSILFAGAGLSWAIRYPVVATGESVLTTSAPPIRLVARTGGEISRLFVRDGDHVSGGADLALISNSAEYDDVQRLKGELAVLEHAITGAGRLSDVVLRPQLTLGDVQESYLQLQQHLSDYHSSNFDAFNAAKVAAVRAEISNLERQRLSLAHEQRTSVEQLEIARRQPMRYREFVGRQDRPLTDAERQVMSPMEIDQAENQYLQRRVAVEQSAGALEGNAAQIASRRGTLVELEQEQHDAQRTRLLTLQASLIALRGAIIKWEQQYIIRAPAAGRVSFLRILGPGQFVEAAEPILAVIPRSESGELVARVLLADANAARVRVGQRVVLRLNGFPADEFGTLRGRVVRISLLPTERQTGKGQDQSEQIVHLVEVSLPDGLRTSHGEVIAFRQEMHGSAEIVTDNLRLLQRVFLQLSDLVSRTTHT